MYSGKKAQHDFPKMRGGGDKRPFGTFPKIHHFWKRRPSLNIERVPRKTGFSWNLSKQNSYEMCNVLFFLILLSKCDLSLFH